MQAARIEYYAALRSMLALAGDRLLTDTFPPNAPHNRGARILRHGLAVAAFSSLEKYIETRFQHLMRSFTSSPLSYAAFSNDLKRFLTVEAVVGLATKTKFRAHADRQLFSESALKEIGGYLAGTAPYSAFGFSPRGSNVSRTDIESAFKACGLAHCWTHMGSISSAIGASRVSLAVDFDQLARTRNRSAHDPSGNVPTANLVAHIETAILIGIAADILSTAIERAYASSSTTAQLRVAITGMSYPVRYVDEQSDGSWLERSATGYALKRYATELAAVTGAQARRSASSVVLRDTRQVPIGLA